MSNFLKKSKNKNFLALDPGKTVGLAWFELDGSEIKDVYADQMFWVDFLYDFAEVSEEKHFKLLMENYTIRSNTVAANLNKELLTAKIIGVIEWYCRLNDIEYQFQPAGIGNAFFTKKRLKEMNLWIVGKHHARDAIRHGMWHLTFGRDEEATYE
jgi:hypothetical protein